MLIDKNIVIDASHFYPKTKNKFLDCEWIDDNHFSISQKEFIRRVPDNRLNIIEYVCDKCGELKLTSPRCYKEINGKIYCRGCKTSITLMKPEVKAGIEKTNFERYGGKCSLCSPVIRRKIEATNIKRYNCKNPLQRPEIKRKRVKTNRKIYGYDNASQNLEVKKKQLITAAKKGRMKMISQQQQHLAKLLHGDIFHTEFNLLWAEVSRL